jgi:glycosyltransferase involved in cell wall biosynthesis
MSASSTLAGAPRVLEAPPRAEPAPDPVPEARPAWDHRDGCLAYVAKMFPRISETFILEEILALQRNGVPIRIYSLLPPVRDARVHPEAAALLPAVQILEPPERERWRCLFRDLVACARVRPGGTVKLLLRSLVSRHPARSLRRLARAASLAVRLRRDHVSHVYAAWAHGPASVARVASRITGIPWSMAAHAKDIHLSDPRSLAKKLASARFTLACSAANRDLLAALAPRPEPGRPGPQVALIHHGVDAAYFTPAPEPARNGSRPHDPVILSVGRLVEKKGFDCLLAAAELLALRGFRFTLEIVGDGPERARLERQIEELGLTGRVVLRGMRVRDEVREAFRRASVFALACRVTADGDRDGIPNTLAEAMACALPVVCTRLPGVEEIVRDGETGSLVPPGEPAALAEALADVLIDPPRACALGARARAWVEAHFDGRANGDRRAFRLGRALAIERVLYVSADRGVPVRGHKGASVHVRSVADGIVGLGVETRILTSRAGAADGPAPMAPLVEARSDRACAGFVAWLARWSGGGEALERAILRLLDNLWLYPAGRREIETWRPDLVYERYALTAVAGAALARYLRVPLVLEVNAPLADEERAFRGLRLGWLARRIEGWLLRRADVVVVVSWALHAHALRLGVRHERIRVLPNAVDPGRFHAGHDGHEVRRRLGLDGAFVVGFCGSLKRWHGVHHLIAAAAEVDAARELRILIVGDGPERDRLIRQAEDLGLGERVRFSGAVPHDAVPAHLAACDLLAAPYEPSDGFYFSPLKLAEYLAVGRPVVASAVGEIPRTFGGIPGVTLVGGGDTPALARAIEQHAVDRARRNGARVSPAPAPWS